MSFLRKNIPASNQSSHPEKQQSKVTHAAVFFYKEGYTEISLISRIDKFFPKNNEDFDIMKKYTLWTDDKSECKRVNILRLGSKCMIIDITFNV